MRILYIIPALQHPKLRGATRHYHFVKELSERHEITLLSLVRSSVAQETLADIEALTEDLMVFNVNGESRTPGAEVLGKLPYIGEYLKKSIKLSGGVRDMKRAFERLVKTEDFDLVLFHGKSVFPVIADWSGLPIVTDFCDATSLRLGASMRYRGLLKAPFYFVKMLQMRKLEKRLIEKSTEVAFISSRDRKAVLGADDRSPLLPLGVDYDFWHRQNGSKPKRDIVFTGVMDYAPNHDAAMQLINKILPQLRKKLSDFRIVIAGRDPLPELIERAAKFPEVVVTGFVEDVRPYLEDAIVFAAPIRYASGTQNKVLEAMAMEVPVVATRLVADGLFQDEYGEPPLLNAKNDKEFVGAIVDLFEDNEGRALLAAEGKRFVTTYYNWSNSAARLEEICQRAVS